MVSIKYGKSHLREWTKSPNEAGNFLFMARILIMTQHIIKIQGLLLNMHPHSTARHILVNNKKKIVSRRSKPSRWWSNHGNCTIASFLQLQNQKPLIHRVAMGCERGSQVRWRKFLHSKIGGVYHGRIASFIVHVIGISVASSYKNLPIW